MDPLDGSHPLVRRWFEGRFAAPTPAQACAWAAIRTGRDTLVCAPTGSGKTLAAFLWGIDELVRAADAGRLEDATHILYVSPLRALAVDVQRNLREPLEQMAALAGGGLPTIRVAVRSGDTTSARRAQMLRQPPHILITTPESLYLLLTAERSRELLRTVRAVIVDEIHSVAGDVRGAHLALSLERLEALCGRSLQRIGLSATVRPVEDVAALLVGARPQPHIVDVGHVRRWEVRVEVPEAPLGPIATHDVHAWVYDRIATLARSHRTTLVFVDTRRMAERVAHALEQRLGEGRAVAHHGSLARTRRQAVEQGLKDGALPVVVATASLELGIDIGSVDLVCQLGAPRSLTTLVQRIGRSGHHVGGVARGVLFPLTRDQLVQCAAAVAALHDGALDRIRVPHAPLDVLAQHIVATVAAEEIAEEALFALVRRAYPYRHLDRGRFEAVLEMLCEGVAGRHGRRSALLLRDRVHGVLRPRRGARLAALTGGGAIPDTADYDVVEEPTGALVGSVNEDFAVESLAGDVFLLGTHSWRVRRVGQGRVWVEDAQGAPPTVPFWLGEAPGRTPELSAAVSALRQHVADAAPDAAVDWLVAHTGVDRAGAAQIVEHIAGTVAALGAVPTTRRVIAERFFDDAGGMQLVIHAPFGARITRAWGLALRKRFCVTFDFELQAAATDDGIVLSLGPQHSFPLDAVWAMLRAAGVRETLVQAVLQSPLFTTRWRWVATRALALRRHQGGRRVPTPIQRMRAEDLLAAVFPAQVACQDNAPAGPIEVPDHPLVAETLRSCLEEALDVEGLEAVLRGIEDGTITTVAVDTPAPSPAAHELLNADPYAFLDDAPLEERRARAVALRQVLPNDAAALDVETLAEAVANPDIRDAHELHDLLLTVVLLPCPHPWESLAAELVADGRALEVRWTSSRRAHVATERAADVAALLPAAEWSPIPPRSASPAPPSEVLAAVLRGHLQHRGPTTAGELEELFGCGDPEIRGALGRLEAEGTVLRGRFRPDTAEEQWCDREVLARWHRTTVRIRRQAVEPVPVATFVRFLLRWQHLHPGTQLHGPDGVLEVVTQLQGLELPAAHWESVTLPARVAGYVPGHLDSLCLSGLVVWGRLRGPEGQDTARRARAHRLTPIGLLRREDAPWLLAPADPNEARCCSGAAQEILEILASAGPSFTADLVRTTGRLPGEVEEALGELVGAGLVTADSPLPMRRLAGRRRSVGRRLRRAHLRPGAEGRWACWRVGLPDVPHGERVEAWAAQLLRRYGVVCRELAAAERHAPSWRELVAVYRRWEAQGRIRGGRFIAGTVGEQFARPEAVDALRALRRAPTEPEVVRVPAGDPADLIGVLLPGERPADATVITYRDGAPVLAGMAGGRAS